jgi:(2Fe-2S) ferredoxin
VAHHPRRKAQQQNVVHSTPINRLSAAYSRVLTSSQSAILCPMTDIESARAAAAKRGIGHYDRHIFLCIGPDCCTPEEGDRAWGQLKQAAARLNGSPDSGRLYRSKVGSLRICEAGPTAVVYPEGTWYGCLSPENLDRVINEHLVNGQEVPDLVIGRNPLPNRES